MATQQPASGRLSPYTNGTSPRDHDWGERTVQAFGGAERAPGYFETDAYEIRQYYGVPKLDEDDYRENPKARMTYPSLIIHEKARDRTPEPPGGKDCLIKGKERGCGKSTLLNEAEVRMMDENGEKIIRRGSSERSEWLPYRRWATLWLPAGLEITAQWMRELEDDAGESLGQVDDLEDVVREVKYYDGVRDLLEQLGDHPAGTYNVVYPDPAFRDCEALTTETDRVEGTLPFTPRWEADPENGQPACPVVHWWVTFALGRLEHGPFQWMTLSFDEGGDLLPQSASNRPGLRTYDKVKLFRSVMADSRRALLSVVVAIHYEENMHEIARREFNRRIHMPDGSPNPQKRVRGTHPVGFDTVPMFEDIMSDETIGTGLCYTERDFTKFRWGDIPGLPEDQDRWLKIRVGEPTSPGAITAGTDDEDVELEYDDRIFGEWQNQSAHRLIVKAPGAGYVEVSTAQIGEVLESPLEDLAFLEGLHDTDRYREVRMTDGDDEIVVARLPKPSTSTNMSAGGESGVAS